MVRIDPPPAAIRADQLESVALTALSRAKMQLMRGNWKSAREVAETAVRALRELEVLDAAEAARRGMETAV